MAVGAPRFFEPSLHAKKRLWGASLRLLARALFGVRLVSVDSLRDDPRGDRLEMRTKRRVQFLELRPEDLLRKRTSDARHDRGTPLTGVAVRLDAVPPEQGHEEGLRPPVRKRKAVFDRALRLLELLEAPPHAISCTLRCRLLAYGRRS